MIIIIIFRICCPAYSETWALKRIKIIADFLEMGLVKTFS